MTREELRNNYEKGICELCHREYYTSRALPESLCEGQFCEEAEDSFAVYNNVPLATPDGKSVFMPDCTYELADGNIVSLYSFN